MRNTVQLPDDISSRIDSLVEADRGEFASEAEIEAVSRAWPERL